MITWTPKNISAIFLDNISYRYGQYVSTAFKLSYYLTLCQYKENVILSHYKSVDPRKVCRKIRNNITKKIMTLIIINYKFNNHINNKIIRILIITLIRILRIINNNNNINDNNNSNNNNINNNNNHNNNNNNIRIE